MSRIVKTEPLKSQFLWWKVLLWWRLWLFADVLLSLGVPPLLRCEPHLLVGQTRQSRHLLVASSRPSVAILLFLNASFLGFLRSSYHPPMSFTFLHFKLTMHLQNWWVNEWKNPADPRQDFVVVGMILNREISSHDDPLWHFNDNV